MSGIFGGGASGGFLGGGGHVTDQRTKVDTRSATGQSYADNGGQSISGIQLQDSASVTLSDLGAVNAAFGFSENVLKSLGEATAAALKGSSDATANVAEAFRTAQGQAGAIDADTLAKLGLAALVVMVLTVVYLGRKQ